MKMMSSRHLRIPVSTRQMAWRLQAPVFGDATLDSILGGFPIVGDALKNTLLADGSGSKEFPMLPSPLGQVLATIPYFERLPIADRASMVGLLIATIDW